LLYSNAFVGIGAVLFCYEGYFLLHIDPKVDVVLLLSGAATMFIYLLIRVAATQRIREYEPELRWDFFKKHIRVLYVLTILTGCITLIIFLRLPRTVQLVLLIPGAISVLYGLPFAINKKRFRLRDVGVAKIFLIAFVWAFIASILPAVNFGLSIFDTSVWILFAAHFCFIFGITLPFDIKDLKIDALHQVKTIPALIGIENSYTLAFTSLFISSMLHLLLQREVLTGYDYTIPLGISMLLSGWSVFLTRKKADNFVYFGIIDGMLIVQALLIILY
jgi:4-hydroxybenzoate polyprenyltransferase